LNIGRHLRSAGRPSRLALAHILVLTKMPEESSNNQHPLHSSLLYSCVYLPDAKTVILMETINAD